MPLTAYIISMLASPPWIFLAYTITDTLIFAVLSKRYIAWKEKDKKEDYMEGQQIVLYMTVAPDEAVSASKDIRKLADEYNIDPKIANRVSLSMEEMVAYAEEVRDDDTGKGHRRKKKNEEEDVFSVQVMIRFRGENAATVVTYDDGHKINLDMDEDKRELAVSNYELLRRLAKSLEYQYVLDMNYTTIRFEV
jgi:hypothetical protein